MLCGVKVVQGLLGMVELSARCGEEGETPGKRRLSQGDWSLNVGSQLSKAGSQLRSGCLSTEKLKQKAVVKAHCNYCSLNIEAIAGTPNRKLCI